MNTLLKITWKYIFLWTVVGVITSVLVANSNKEIIALLILIIAWAAVTTAISKQTTPWGTNQKLSIDSTVMYTALIGLTVYLFAVCAYYGYSKNPSATMWVSLLLVVLPAIALQIQMSDWKTSSEHDENDEPGFISFVAGAWRILFTTMITCLALAYIILASPHVLRRLQELQ